MPDAVSGVVAGSRRASIRYAARFCQWRGSGRPSSVRVPASTARWTAGGRKTGCGRGHCATAVAAVTTRRTKRRTSIGAAMGGAETVRPRHPGPPRCLGRPVQKRWRVARRRGAWASPCYFRGPLARVAELVDAHVSGTCSFTGVLVRFQSRAPRIKAPMPPQRFGGLSRCGLPGVPSATGLLTLRRVPPSLRATLVRTAAQQSASEPNRLGNAVLHDCRSSASRTGRAFGIGNERSDPRAFLPTDRGRKRLAQRRRA